MTKIQKFIFDVIFCIIIAAIITGIYGLLNNRIFLGIPYGFNIKALILEWSWSWTFFAITFIVVIIIVKLDEAIAKQNFLIKLYSRRGY